MSNIDKQSKFPLRKTLVGMQFAISIMLILGTMVVMAQMEYMRGKDMGFAKDNILTLMFPEPDYKRQALLKNEIEKLPGVQMASLNLGSPLANTNNTDKYYNPEVGEKEQFTVNDKIIDENYIDVFGIELVAGRNVLTSDDEYKVLVTEKLVEKMGISSPHVAVGKALHTSWGGKFQIVGVVKDFNVNSLHEEMMPVILRYQPDFYFEMSVKLASNDAASTAESIKQINNAWESAYPELIIEYGFLDQRIASRYEMESVIAKMLNFFALMAIFICAIGLYGLTDFMANAKKKEIGVRKIVGASNSQILMIFFKEVGIVLAIAFVLSATSTYFGMQTWLETYAYRISIDWTMIAMAFAFTLLITVLTMGWRSVRAAQMNMIEILKDE